MPRLTALDMKVHHPSIKPAPMSKCGIELGDLRAPGLERLEFEGQADITIWPDLPALTYLKIDAKGCKVSLAELSAPQLPSVELVHCALADLRGCGGFKEINFQSCTVSSLNGLQGNRLIERLTLYTLVDQLDSLAPLAELPQLKRLILGTSHNTHCAHWSSEKVAALLSSGPPLPQIEVLQLDSYAGDLSALKGWTGLKTLFLCDSGGLDGMETLLELPQLALIQVRGSSTDRKSWPERLHDILDYKSAYSKYRSRF
jgi:hypothetical protein